MLESRITVLDARMVDIDRSDKNVILDDGRVCKLLIDSTATLSCYLFMMISNFILTSQVVVDDSPDLQ